ncbi:MAG: TolC family protein [Holosporales bacterium]|jgi:outer membrane protein|nr:TolC family protein [Holosporales bacterium]
MGSKFILLICFPLFTAFNVMAVEDKTKTGDSNTVTATESGKNPLFAALESALRNNREILSAQDELMALHENHVSASASFRPTVSANTQYQSVDKKMWRSKSSGDGARNNVRSYGLTLKQNIFHGFADVAALNEVDFNIKAKWSAYETTKQNVLRNVAICYFVVIAKKQEIVHLNVLLDSRKESISVATEMHRTGVAKYLDVAQAEASYAETMSKLAKAEAEYASYMAQFEEISGYKMPDGAVAPGKLFDDAMSEKQALDIAVKHNPGIIAATNVLQAAKAAVKKINPEFTPSLDMTCSFDHSVELTKRGSGENADQAKNKYNTRGCTFGVALTVPIYDGGAVRAEKRKHVKMASKAAVDREKAIEELKTQISSVWASITAAKKNLVAAKSAVKARELALHDTNEEYKAGVKIMKDVLEAQGQLFEAKYLEIQAEQEYFSNQCKANALVGRMDARYLKVKDGDFSYKKHFAETSGKF